MSYTSPRNRPMEDSQQLRERCKRAQVWYPDYAVGLVIFVLFLMIFYAFINNYTLEEKKTLSDLTMDAKSVSAALLTAGYPSNWSQTNVTRIGLTNNDNRLNETKVDSMKKMEYGTTKNVLGTQFDYLISFTNKFGKGMNINGSCFLGKGSIAAYYDDNKTHSAYYSSNISDFALLNTFKNRGADLYYSNFSPGMTITDGIDTHAVAGGLDEFISNLTDYHLVFIDNPAFDKNNKNYSPTNYDYSAFEIAVSIENWVASGNWLFLSGSVNLGEFADADFGGICYNGTSPNCNNRTYSGTGKVTIFAADSILMLDQGEELFYRRNASFRNINAEGFLAAGNYSDNSTGIASWRFNAGHVHYLPETSMTGEDGSLTNYPGDFADGFAAINATRCPDFSLNSSVYHYLIPTTRFAIYRSELIAMNIYLWEDDI